MYVSHHRPLLHRYFEEEDDVDNSCLQYIPAPGSPTGKLSTNQESDDDEDPLDAFMAGIEKQVLIPRR